MKVTKEVRARRRKSDEAASVVLAIDMALENSEMFEDYADCMYPTQGRVLYNALRRAKKQERALAAQAHSGR